MNPTESKINLIKSYLFCHYFAFYVVELLGALLLMPWCVSLLATEAKPLPLSRIMVAVDGKSFADEAGAAFTPWGVNYDHDADGRLLEDYWTDEWPTVEADFREIRKLGCNVVRIHLQLGRFMTSPTQSNASNLNRLADLLKLAERERLYLDLTGLGCYHRADVPSWYTDLDEVSRWNVQAEFWKAIAVTCKESSVVFCYDLMNEPIVPGKKVETDWLTGELAGKTFVQRISLDLAGRSGEDVARAWIQRLTATIREVDPGRLITVGAIPWAYAFPGAKPLFYSPGVGDDLDFVSVHFYPKADDAAGALKALRVYDVGKPIVIEEMFPLLCSVDVMAEFIELSKPVASGWISFYWGKTALELRQKNDLPAVVTATWLEWMTSNSPATSNE